jgi:hypothetical protein
MPNDTAVNSTLINDLDNSFVTIHVTGLRQHKNLRRGFCTFKVPRSNMSETMRRINRMGGQIVEVKVTSQYEIEEVETDFVAPEIVINTYTPTPEKQEVKPQAKIEVPVIETTPEVEAQVEEAPVIESTPEVEAQVEESVNHDHHDQVESHHQTPALIQPDPAKPATRSSDQGKKVSGHKSKKGWKSKRK